MDFDLDRSTAEAWSEFEHRLAEVLSVMDDSADLTISAESGPGGLTPCLWFSCPERDLLRAEAGGQPAAGSSPGVTSSAVAPEQAAALARAGWSAPTTTGPRPTPHFWLEDAQDHSDRVSARAVAALRDVFGVTHPVFLAPDQLGEVLRGSPRDDQEYALVPRAAHDRQQLDALVDRELTRMYGHVPLRDGEGDVAIRVGSTMLFLRTSPDGQEVIVFAAVVHDVEGRSRAAEVLNDLNVEARWVKFQLVRDRVFVTFSVLARPFVAEHLHHAVRVLSEVADGIDEDLAAKLHGRTTFSDPG